MCELVFIGKQDDKMVNTIKAIMQETNVNSFHGTINRITVNLNTRMRSCGGRAFYNTNHIHINYRLFNDNSDNDLRNTFTHEYAHLLAHAIYQRKNIKGHGKEFKAIHKKLGGTGDQYHSMDVSAYKQVRKRTSHPCPNVACDIVFELTAYKMKKLSGLRCGKCKTNLETGIRIERC